MEYAYKGPERRQFVRLDYTAPLAYKVCKIETISKLLQGYTTDVSETGLLCNIKDRVQKEDILWLSFDRDTLALCEELEKRSVIVQKGVIGKVVWVEDKQDKGFDVGVRFITREEKHSYENYYNIRSAQL